MKFQLLLFVVVAIAYAVAEESWKCVEDEFYKENNCNGCHCEDGKLACTGAVCLFEEYRELKKCVVGTVSKRDCNDCICLKDYGTVCTTEDC